MVFSRINGIFKNECHFQEITLFLKICRKDAIHTCAVVLFSIDDDISTDNAIFRR